MVRKIHQTGKILSQFLLFQPSQRLVRSIYPIAALNDENNFFHRQLHRLMGQRRLELSRYRDKFSFYTEFCVRGEATDLVNVLSANPDVKITLTKLGNPHCNLLLFRHQILTGPCTSCLVVVPFCCLC